MATDQANEKLNNLRRLRGKTLYFAHKTIQLKLSEEEQLLIKQTGARGESRAHLVRGHFKVRKNGVFWWSFHIRGDAGKGWINKDYEVVR